MIEIGVLLRWAFKKRNKDDQFRYIRRAEGLRSRIELVLLVQIFQSYTRAHLDFIFHENVSLLKKALTAAENIENRERRVV